MKCVKWHACTLPRYHIGLCTNEKLDEAEVLGGRVLRGKIRFRKRRMPVEENAGDDRLVAPPPPPLQQLVPGSQFVVDGDPRNPHAVASVVALTDNATRFLNGAKGEAFHVELRSFESAAAMQAGRGAELQVRTLDDCHVVRVMPPLRASSRPRKMPRLSHPPSRVEPAAEAEGPLPTIVDDEDLSDLSVGQAVVAFGRAPDGKWTRYRAVVTGFRTAHPKVIVKYASTMDGLKIRLALPSPASAYVSRSDVDFVSTEV